MRGLANRSDLSPRIKALLLIDSEQFDLAAAPVKQSNELIDMLASFLDGACAAYRSDHDEFRLGELRNAVDICRAEVRLHEIWKTNIEACLMKFHGSDLQPLKQALTGTTTHRDHLLIKIVFAEEVLKQHGMQIPTESESELD
jgi:hypothetical protein